MVKMKDSGIEWIGEIPEDWKLELFKNILYERAEKNFPIKSKERLSLSIDKGVTLYSEKTTNLDRFKEDFDEYKLAYEGDLVMNSMNVISGAVGISKYFGCVSPAYYTYYDKDKEHYYARYCDYVFRCQTLRRLLFALGKGIMAIDRGNGKVNTCRLKVAREDLGRLQLPFPSYEKIKTIVNVLDSKCKTINELKNDIQKQIETLEQYKKSVITEAVTKGINPNVKMKDSGIEWIGEIPEYWEIHPVYFYFEERKNKNTLCKEQNLLSLSYGNVIRKDINSLGGLLPESFNTYNIIEKDDIVIRPTDLQNDKRSLRTGLCKERGIITSAYITLKPKKNVSSKYFHYLLHTYDIEKVFYNMGNGVRQGLNYSEFAKLMLICPSLDDQQFISNYLESKCSSIDNIILSKKQQLEKLEEYKKSLIFEYVTGKESVA